MAITFAPLRRYMKDNGISYYFLSNQGIDNRTLHRIRHDEPVTTVTLNKLCVILGVCPEQLIEFKADEVKIP